MQLSLTISSDGVVRFVWNDALQTLLALGDSQIRRVSYVEPTDDEQWMADLWPVDGPVLGPFDLRGDALAAEAAWLGDNL